jgi:hypothetical protein
LNRWGNRWGTICPVQQTAFNGAGLLRKSVEVRGIEPLASRVRFLRSGFRLAWLQIVSSGKVGRRPQNGGSDPKESLGGGAR